MKTKILLNKVALSVAAMLLSLSIFAQGPVSVSGKVTDDNGNPLPGVYVSAEGTDSSTCTGSDGSFTLAVPAGAKNLAFDMLGFKHEVITMGSQTVFSVILSEDAQMLEETVVVGYGTMIRSELSSSVASVSGDDLTDRASAMNINQSMAGKLAGVQVRANTGRPGDEGHVRVRGMGSINASSDPLYVVDGVVDVDPSLVNYADVEKIDVLKDAAAAAIYGAKGANGVVIITTKSGTKGKASVTFSTQTGVNVQARRLGLLNSEEYLSLLNQAYRYSGDTTPPYLETPDERLFTYKMNGSDYARDKNGYLIPTPKYNTDWQDVAYRTAIISTNNLSFTAGNEKTSIYANLGYQNNQGTYIKTGAQKYSGSINIKSHIKDWLDVSFGSSISRMEEKRCPESSSLGWYNDGIQNATYLSPLLPVQYEDGTYSNQSDIGFGNNLDNPVEIMNKYTNDVITNNFLLNGGLDFHIAKGLDLTIKGSYNTKKLTNNLFIAKGLAGITDVENMASINNSDVTRWSNEDYLTYKNTFFDGALKSDFVLGASFYSYTYETSTATAKNISEELFSYHNLGTGTNLQPASSGYDKITMNSYYFRTNQVILGRYMVGLTLRADGASNFGANQKFGFFPSASVAWNIAAEPWFASAKDVMNQLKLRVSYGAVGNSSIGSYKTFSQFSSGTIWMDGVANPYVKFANLANNDLSWETIKQFDAGLDIGFLNDRINLIADFYIKDSDNLLFNKSIPYTTGYNTATMNVGKLRNRGFELTLNAHVIDHREFKWDLDVIWSTNKTIALDLVDDPFTTGGNSAMRAYKGKEYATWYVYHRLGTWSTDEIDEAAKYNCHPGDPKIWDKNNDGVINYDDRVDGDSVLPKGELSMINTFFWKGFTASIDLGGLYGFSVFNHENTVQDCNLGCNNTTRVNLKAWTPCNQNTMIPAVRTNSDDHAGTYYGYEIDDYYVEKADFVRIRNIGINYDFGYKLLKNSKVIHGLSFGVNAENVYVFTNYTGYDPEIGTTFDSAPAVIGSYPRPMTITGNLKITF